MKIDAMAGNCCIKKDWGSLHRILKTDVKAKRNKT
jgi:hypothetical protein